MAIGLKNAKSQGQDAVQILVKLSNPQILHNNKILIEMIKYMKSKSNKKVPKCTN